MIAKKWPRSQVWESFKGLEWFNGWNPLEHKVAIFDEFRNDWETLSTFLRITHEYPARVNAKGGDVFFNPELVIFTCPDTPDMHFVKHLTGADGTAGSVACTN